MKPPAWSSINDSFDAAGATIQRPLSEPPDEAKPGWLEVGVNRPSASVQSLDIQKLLRRRLRIIVLIALAALTAYNALRFIRHDLTPAIVWRTMVPGAV